VVFNKTGIRQEEGLKLTVETRDARRKLPAERRGELDAEATPTAKMDGLMDCLLDDSTEDDTSALWLEPWGLGRRNAPPAAEAKALTTEWLECIADIVRAGSECGEFRVADAEVAARRLLTMIDGLGAQMVVRAVPSAEATHIARAYFASELGMADSRP
jgi:hypothetical protein